MVVESTCYLVLVIGEQKLIIKMVNPGAILLAVFRAFLNCNGQGQLVKAVTEIIQRTHPDVRKVTLKGFASLLLSLFLADTFVESSLSSSAITSNTKGRAVRFAKHLAQGFNSVWIAGADYLVGVDRINPNFEGAGFRDDGHAQVLDFIQLSHPDRPVRWEIVKENTSDRLLTDADFGVVFTAVAADSTIWMGSKIINLVKQVEQDPVRKIGIYLDKVSSLQLLPKASIVINGDFHTCGDLIHGIGLVPAPTADCKVDGKPEDLNGDTTIGDADRILGTSTFLVKDAPSAGLLVHSYTFRHDRQAELEQCLHMDGYFTDFPCSQGFEGLAISPDGQTLYLLLKGIVFGDPATSLRIYQFDVQLQQYKGLFGYYRLEEPSHAIGDFTTVNQNEYLVIERDNNQGSAAKFRKIFKVDLSQKDADGFVAKEEVVDLLKVGDLYDLDGNGNNKLAFPFQITEDILVLDAKTLLVANENNYPLATRRPPVVDNKEFLILELDKPLPLIVQFTVKAETAGSNLVGCKQFSDGKAIALA